jgi:DNA polymerase phi
MGGKRKHTNKETAGAEPQSHKRIKKTDKGTTSTTPSALETTQPFVEDPSLADRKREALIYEKLASEDENDRIKGAETFFACLLEGEGTSELALWRVLERLCRGLSSGRNAARVGFSFVLTELITQLYSPGGLKETKYTNTPIELVLQIVARNTKAEGNISGQEERDFALGRLFGLQCFVNGGILQHYTSDWRAVLDHLLELGERKVWLRSQCGWTIAQAVRKLDYQSAEETLNLLEKKKQLKTPEGLGVWITAADQFEEVRQSEKWKDPLSGTFLQKLPAILKESGRETTNDGEASQGKRKQANRTAQLHPVWDIILEHFRTKLGQKSKSKQMKSAREHFSLFWAKVVDGE